MLWTGLGGLRHQSHLVRVRKRSLFDLKYPALVATNMAGNCPSMWTWNETFCRNVTIERNWWNVQMWTHRGLQKVCQRLILATGLSEVWCQDSSVYMFIQYIHISICICTQTHNQTNRTCNHLHRIYVSTTSGEVLTQLCGHFKGCSLWRCWVVSRAGASIILSTQINISESLLNNRNTSLRCMPAHMGEQTMCAYKCVWAPTLMEWN